MSSFLLDAIHFNSVEHAITKLMYKDDFYIPWSMRNILPFWYDERNVTFNAIEDEIKGLFKTIKELSVKCVTLQYKNDETPDEINKGIKLAIYDVNRKTDLKDLSNLGLFNALCCIQYQIEIEHLTKIRNLTKQERKAMKFLKMFIDVMTMYICRHLPEDSTNTWQIN